jgi:N-acetylneuraminate synthase
MMGFRIGDRQVGSANPCFVIAEAGVNHNGDPNLAHRLVDTAADAGADAVKFQTFNAERLVTRDAPKADYQRQASAPDETQFEMLRRLELAPDAYRDLMAHCATRGILFLSTPFDEESADLLAALNIVAFKIPSGEMTNAPLLAHVARKGKPIILSTGMSTLGEVEAGVRTLLSAGAGELALLHCVSAYPADPADVNLRAMRTLQEMFQVPVGYSDHTTGLDIAWASVAAGASLLEKHFTLDRTLPGPDHRASIEPGELGSLIAGVRRIERALGHGRKEPAASEAPIAAVARKSLVAACDIPAGTVVMDEMIVVRRPGTGLPPAARSSIIGRRARSAISGGTVIASEMLA